MTLEKSPLHRVDLNTNSRDTLAALIKLLTPHVPYSVHILGAILNVGPRDSTLQDIDPSKVCLWSTIPLDPAAIQITDPAPLFSVVVFSHLNKQFCVFCSSESSASAEPPSESEQTHVKRVFECIRDVARDAKPLYDAWLMPPESLAHTLRLEPDAHMIVVGAVHPRWATVLAPMAACQSLNVRYAFPRGALGSGRHDSNAVVEGVEVSEIREEDLPFVHGASSIQRSDAYILSRAPYSVCLRMRRDAVVGADREPGRPVACALMHADGSIGALRVDEEHQRRGLGKLVLRFLAEKLDFSEERGDPGLILDDHRDLGGGALGWNWMDTGVHNQVANSFFTSLIGKDRSRPCHWTYILVDRRGREQGQRCIQRHPQAR